MPKTPKPSTRDRAALKIMTALAEPVMRANMNPWKAALFAYAIVDALSWAATQPSAAPASPDLATAPTPSAPAAAKT